MDLASTATSFHSSFWLQFHYFTYQKFGTLHSPSQVMNGRRSPPREGAVGAPPAGVGASMSALAALHTAYLPQALSLRSRPGLVTGLWPLELRVHLTHSHKPSFGAHCIL